MTYLDAAYIAKFYISEPDSGRVRSFLVTAPPAVSCVHAMAEVASVFHRKLREGTMPQPDFDFICAQFEADCQAGLWTWLPLLESLAHMTRRNIGKLPPTTFLRAADALHLACAADAGLKEIYSHDRHLLAAAPHFGLRGIDLISPKSK